MALLHKLLAHRQVEACAPRSSAIGAGQPTPRSEPRSPILNCVQPVKNSCLKGEYVVGVGTLLVLLGLAAFVIAVTALIRGHLCWARIPTRRVGLFVLLGSLVAFVGGGALMPSPATTPVSGSPSPTEPAQASVPTNTSTPTGPVPGAPTDVQGPYQVLDILSGDTYEITRPEETLVVRLIGIDTPQAKDPNRPRECFGNEATQAAERILDSQKVWLRADPTQDDQDRYEHQLVYLWLADGTLVNEKLIRDGFAVEDTYQKPYQHRDAFRTAQDEARQASRGMWSASTCNGDPDQTTQQPSTAPAPRQSSTASAPPVKPAPAPRRTTAPAPPSPPRVKQAPPSSGGGGSAHYKNCAAARAAGVAPLRRGEPGYRPGLDRDKDGVACE